MATKTTTTSAATPVSDTNTLSVWWVETYDSNGIVRTARGELSEEGAIKEAQRFLKAGSGIAKIVITHRSQLYR